jgi:hypothetical protein
MEKYKQIIGFENYEVSDFGNVRNFKTGRILKARISKRGYYQLGLYKNKKFHSVKIHRIVALMFLENKENFTDVDHKDRNRLNNIPSNLRWVTKKTNNDNSMLGKNSYITFNDVTNKFLVYHSITHQYFEYNHITDATSKFLSLIK